MSVSDDILYVREKIGKARDYAGKLNKTLASFDRDKDDLIGVIDDITIGFDRLLKNGRLSAAFTSTQARKCTFLDAEIAQAEQELCRMRDGYNFRAAQSPNN